MVRVVLYLFLTVIVISLIRGVIGVLGKAVSLFLSGNVPEVRPEAGAQKTGELKRDPVCGTYVATESSVQRTFNGKVVYFCSTACCDKYQPSKA